MSDQRNVRYNLVTNKSLSKRDLIEITLEVLKFRKRGNNSFKNSLERLLENNTPEKLTIWQMHTCRQILGWAVKGEQAMLESMNRPRIKPSRKISSIVEFVDDDEEEEKPVKVRQIS